MSAASATTPAAPATIGPPTNGEGGKAAAVLTDSNHADGSAANG